MTEELTKVCTKCGRELPLSEFTKHKRYPDGLQYWCRECQKEYYKIYSNYYECVKKPSCPRVGRHGAVFETFTCEICGTEFRRLKSNVEYNYHRHGNLPRFCSRECRDESRRKTHKSKYEKEIERIKKET